MAYQTNYLWLVIWRLGMGGRQTDEHHVCADTIAVDADKTAPFETFMTDKAMPDAARGATRGGSLVVEQLLLKETDSKAARGGLELLRSDFDRELETLIAAPTGATARRYSLVRRSSRTA